MEASVQRETMTVDDRERLASRISLSMKAIESFCDRWQVEELALFGSVLRDDFRPESDIDILVRFKPECTPGLFEVVEMEWDLGEMFGRRCPYGDAHGCRGKQKLHPAEGNPRICAGIVCRAIAIGVRFLPVTCRAKHHPSWKACPTTNLHGTGGLSCRF